MKLINEAKIGLRIAEAKIGLRIAVNGFLKMRSEAKNIKKLTKK